MSTRIPLNILAARVKALEATIADIKSEYEQWLEAAQEFEHGLSTTVEKLESVSDDLWSIEIEAPTNEQLADMAQPTIIAPASNHVEIRAALPAVLNGKPQPLRSLDDEIPF